MNETVINTTIIVLSCSTLLLTGVCSFLIGYICGKNSIASGVYNVVNNKPKSFFDNTDTNKANKISIDNSTFVSDIKTDNLEKKYDKLGEVKQTSENIGESVNKLKNLKR